MARAPRDPFAVPDGRRGGTERHLQARCVARLRARRARGEKVWWLKVHGSHFQRAGIPDLLVCYRGRFLAFELKHPTDGSGPTELQKRELLSLERAGAVAAVVRSVEEMDIYLDSCL